MDTEFPLQQTSQRATSFTFIWLKVGALTVQKYATMITAAMPSGYEKKIGDPFKIALRSNANARIFCFGISQPSKFFGR